MLTFWVYATDNFLNGPSNFSVTATTVDEAMAKARYHATMRNSTLHKIYEPATGSYFYPAGA